MHNAPTTAAHQRSPHVRIAGSVIAILSLGLTGCIATALYPPSGAQAIVVNMETTGYCNCGNCCNWEYDASGLGSPVVRSGPHKGHAKTVGITSSDTETHHGTIAADLSRYPYGTLIEIPGYGIGRVEDTGSAIHGNHLDLWFPDHEQAQKWGRQTRPVRVWFFPVQR